MFDVSVVVTVYNVEKYVEECVESIMLQKFSNIEILLIDDGSTDGSAGLCDALARRDARINVVHQLNQGVSVARNIGVEHARGTWISFVDGDDYIHPEMLERLICKARDNDSDVCICDYYVVANDNVLYPASFIPDKNSDTFEYFEILENCMLGNRKKGNLSCIGVPWAKIYKREYLIENNLLFPVGLKRNQDVIFNLYALTETRKINYLNEALYYYRVWPGSAVNKYSSDYYYTVIAILSYMHDYFYNDAGEAKQTRYVLLYEQRVIDMFYECLRIQVFHPDNRKPMREKYIEFLELCFNPATSIRYVSQNMLTNTQIIQAKMLKYCPAVVFVILYLKAKLRKR